MSPAFARHPREFVVLGCRAVGPPARSRVCGREQKGEGGREVEAPGQAFQLPPGSSSLECAPGAQTSLTLTLSDLDWLSVSPLSWWGSHHQFPGRWSSLMNALASLWVEEISFSLWTRGASTLPSPHKQIPSCRRTPPPHPHALPGAQQLCPRSPAPRRPGEPLSVALLPFPRGPRGRTRVFPACLLLRSPLVSCCKRLSRDDPRGGPPFPPGRVRTEAIRPGQVPPRKPCCWFVQSPVMLPSHTQPPSPSLCIFLPQAPRSRMFAGGILLEPLSVPGLGSVSPERRADVTCPGSVS